jgi:nitroimidazol reductase NimA-like FMN-containing flavoprotein (pyridoxamine 5'-phosphate oxidase superfamily)
MELGLKDLILRLLNEHRVMTIATNRPDGWPQATMAGYVNDGFMLYCFVARNCQKHTNILRDPRVSITIGSDVRQPLDIQALSLAGRASVVDDGDERDHVAALRLRRFPEYGGPPPPVRGAALSCVAPRPPSSGVVLLRIAPEIFSVLDYSKGFGHSDLVTFSERDLDLHLETLRHEWDRRAETSGDDDRPEPPAGR